MSKNHFKSFDHRSFYFKQTDKKYLSTKQLVQEIVSHPVITQPIADELAEDLLAAGGSKDSGVMYSLSPALFSSLAGMTPQMVLQYEGDAHEVHRDIYNILCHAAEHSLASHNDRERLAALWRDLLRVFFNLPVHYLYPSSPSSVATNSSTTATSSSSNGSLIGGEAWPVGSRVLTIYGSATIISYRAEDNIYCVNLQALGAVQAFIHGAAILGAEQLSPQALSVSFMLSCVTQCADIPSIYNRQLE